MFRISGFQFGIKGGWLAKWLIGSVVLSSRCFAPLLRGAWKTSSLLALQILGPRICDPCAAAKSSCISRRCGSDI